MEKFILSEHDSLFRSRKRLIEIVAYVLFILSVIAVVFNSEYNLGIKIVLFVVAFVVLVYGLSQRLSKKQEYIIVDDEKIEYRFDVFGRMHVVFFDELSSVSFGGSYVIVRYINAKKQKIRFDMMTMENMKEVMKVFKQKIENKRIEIRYIEQ